VLNIKNEIANLTPGAHQSVGGCAGGRLRIVQTQARASVSQSGLDVTTGEYPEFRGRRLDDQRPGGASGDADFRIQLAIPANSRLRGATNERDD